MSDCLLAAKKIWKQFLPAVKSDGNCNIGLEYEF